MYSADIHSYLDFIVQSLCHFVFVVSWLSGNNLPEAQAFWEEDRRRIARSKQLNAESWFPSVGIQAAGLSGQSSAALCESGLSELGNFGGLEGCEGYN